MRLVVAIRYSALSLALAVAGCASFTSHEYVKQLERAAATGSPFTQRLTAEYRDFAKFEQYEMFDYFDAEYFAKKGLRSAEGENVLPEEIGAWQIRQEFVNELAEGRIRLMTALDGGARQTAPEQAAVAQARFDCWIEQQEEAHQKDDIAACRKAFADAMAALEAAVKKPEPPIPQVPAPAPQVQEPAPSLDKALFLVFFDFNKTAITPGAGGVLDTIAAEFRKRQLQTISVVGHADRSGADKYNLRLSLKRAAEVKKALVARGVPADLILLDGRGESQPLVATPNGVREPANRRAEIRFE